MILKIITNFVKKTLTFEEQLLNICSKFEVYSICCLEDNLGLATYIFLLPLSCCNINLYSPCTIGLKRIDYQQVLMLWFAVLTAQFLIFFFIFKQTEQEIEIDKIDIVNETVRVTNASSTETITNTLGQKFHITKVLAYDNTGSVSNNFYKVLPNMLEITKLCNINFFTMTQF